MPPRKILKIRGSDIEFGGILESYDYIMCITFKIQIKF